MAEMLKEINDEQKTQIVRLTMSQALNLGKKSQKLTLGVTKRYKTIVPMPVHIYKH